MKVGLSVAAASIIPRPADRYGSFIAAGATTSRVKIKATIRNEATGGAYWGAPSLIYYALTVVGVVGFLVLFVAATRFPNVGQQLRVGGLIWFFALGVARLGVQLWRGRQDARSR